MQEAIIYINTKVKNEKENYQQARTPSQRRTLLANLYSIIRYQRTDNALSDKSKIIILRSDLQVEAEAARRLAICRRCPLHKVTLGVERCRYRLPTRSPR